MRFISPDGRPLAQLLDTEDGGDSGRSAHGGQKTRRGKAEQRWDRGAGKSAMNGWLPGEHNEAEALELAVTL